MSDQQPDQGVPPQPVPSTLPASPAPKRRRWPYVAGVVVALLVGVGIGSSGDKGIPKADYDKVVAENASLVTKAKTAEGKAQDADGRAAAANRQLADAKAALDKRSAELDAREAKVTTAEASYDASHLKPGVYIVGTDIQPGQYRSVADVTGLCYFAQKDGQKILWNDVNKEGRPVATVEAAAGTTFEFGRECGVLEKIS